MTTLAVIVYPEQDTAREAVLALHLLQSEFLIGLDDVAWVTKSQDGKMKLHQGSSMTGIEGATGALWGFVFGLLFLVPVFGVAVGAGIGVLAGKLRDYGLDDRWMKAAADSIPPGGSALFVMARNANQERVLPKMAKFGGTVIKTNLTTEQEQALQAALQLSA